MFDPVPDHNECKPTSPTAYSSLFAEQEVFTEYDVHAAYVMAIDLMLRTNTHVWKHCVLDENFSYTTYFSLCRNKQQIYFRNTCFPKTCVPCNSTFCECLSKDPKSSREHSALNKLQIYVSGTFAVAARRVHDTLMRTSSDHHTPASSHFHENCENAARRNMNPRDSTVLLANV